MNSHRLKFDSTVDIIKDKHISISDQNGVTGPALRCKQLENWTQYTKQLFSDIGQQSKTVIRTTGWGSRPGEPITLQGFFLNTLFRPQCREEGPTGA